MVQNVSELTVMKGSALIVYFATVTTCRTEKHFVLTDQVNGL